MNRFFTLKLYVLSFLFLFSVVTVQAQSVPTCSSSNSVCAVGITEDFSTSNGGFTVSGSGNPNFVYNASAKLMQVGTLSGSTFTAGNTQMNKSYILTSGSFLASNQTTVGFTLGSGAGTVNLAEVRVDLLDIANNSIQSCSYTTSGRGSFCFTFVNNALSGQTIKFQITLLAKNASPQQGTLTFDDFRVAFVDLVVTPVTFVNFKANKSGKGTELTWKVAGESNVKQYDVERSISGSSGFTKIGSVSASGNDSYSFLDVSTPGVTAYYRIKNVDYDGRSKYSTVLLLKNEEASVVFKVVPTVVTSSATVQHSIATGAALITIATIDGRVVRNMRPAAGAMQTSVDMSGLQRGLYLLKWSDGHGQVEVAKVLKQ